MIHVNYCNLPQEVDTSLSNVSIDTKLADRSAKLHSPTLSIREPRNKLNALSTERMQDLDQARQDLAEAQRSKTILQIRLQEATQEFEKLRLQSRNDGKRISDLAIEKASVSKKLKDRDEEIRGKAKLLEVELMYLEYSSN